MRILCALTFVGFFGYSISEDKDDGFGPVEIVEDNNFDKGDFETEGSRYAMFRDKQIELKSEKLSPTAIRISVVQEGLINEELLQQQPTLTVELREVDSVSFQVYEDVGLSMTIKNLLPQAFYEYRAKLILASGRGSPWSEMQFFKMEKATSLLVPSSPPIDIKSLQASASTLHIRWNGPKEEEIPITGYEINIAYELVNETRYLPADKREYELSGVTTETNVSFKVRALNRNGPGPYSSVFHHQISPVTVEEWQTDTSDATTPESSLSPSSEEVTGSSSNEQLSTESGETTTAAEHEEMTTTVSFDSTTEESTESLSNEESSTDIQTSTLRNLVTTAYESTFGEDKSEETQTQDLTSVESTTTSDFLPVSTFSTEDYYTGESDQYTEESDQFSIEQYHTTFNLEGNETTIWRPKIRVTPPPDQVFHGDCCWKDFPVHHISLDIMLKQLFRDLY